MLFEILPNDVDPVLDHLAKVCLEVRRFWSETARRSTSLDDYRISYVKRKPGEDEEEFEIGPDERMRRSKAAWNAMLGTRMKKAKKVQLPDEVKKRTQEFRHGIRN